MKKQISFLTAALFILCNINAQRLYFCDSYTANGEPIGSNTKVACPAEGGFIYFLYQNGNTNLSQGSYYIYVDKLSVNDYLPFDVKMVTADPAVSWFVYDYNFMTTGDYRVTIKNPDMTAMTNEYITLIPEEISSLASSGVVDDASSTFYYSYSTFEATTSVNATTGETPGSFEIFSIDPELGGRIYFKVENAGKALNTQSLSVFIDKKDEYGTSNIYDTKFYPVVSQSKSWDSFYYDFYSTGEYTITVYSATMVFINTLDITVKFKD